MTQGTKVIKTFGINDAWVSAYTVDTAATWINVPLIGSATLELTIQNEDIRDGEGFLDSIWYHSQDASINMVVKTWMMRVLELLSGNAVSSYASTFQEAIHFGTANEIAPAPMRLKLKVQARDHNVSDATTYAYVYVFKATAAFPTFNAAEVTPNNMELNFRALRVQDNDAGNPVAKSYGRIELGSSS